MKGTTHLGWLLFRRSGDAPRSFSLLFVLVFSAARGYGRRRWHRPSFGGGTHGGGPDGGGEERRGRGGGGHEGG